MKKAKGGFTLVELMIVVIVIGTLAAIAYPSYAEYVAKGRRAECKSGILQTANLLERYYTVNNSYSISFESIGGKAFSGDSAEGSACALSIAAGADGIASSFVVKGAPNRADGKCGDLTYASTGQKGKSGSEQLSYCW